jgi:hypothetical protein
MTCAAVKGLTACAAVGALVERVAAVVGVAPIVAAAVAAVAFEGDGPVANDPLAGVSEVVAAAAAALETTNPSTTSVLKPARRSARQACRVRARDCRFEMWSTGQCTTIARNRAAATGTTAWQIPTFFKF